MKPPLGIASRGSIIVENPTDAIKKDLRFFNGNTGTYEPLYTLSNDGSVLATMPGFFGRVSKLCKVEDRRVPMPDPDMESALSDIPEVWRPVARRAIENGGGIVGIPRAIGADVVSAIMKAFPYDALLDRGTPMTVIATSDRERVRRLCYALRRRMPERDIGMYPSLSDDTVICTYTQIDESPLHFAGMFIFMDIDVALDNVEYISEAKNAARWAFRMTDYGDCPDTDIRLEGLFGPCVAKASYADAVSAGAVAPVTVCWLPAPQGNPLGSAPFGVIEAMSMQKNNPFCSMVAQIMRDTPADTGVIMFAEPEAMLERIAALVPDATMLSAKAKVAEKHVIYDNMESGAVRRALVSYHEYIPVCEHVVIAATCKGSCMAAARIPWKRPAGPEDRAYIVEFTHKWDLHNGRPGSLARNDEARMRRYRELGFRQMFVNCVEQLPFM